MPPLKGVCSAFQFGQCKHQSHHKTEDGLDMALHICQPCVQLRQNFVDHTCRGGHSNHPASCGLKRFGAIGCPFQTQQYQQNSQSQGQVYHQNQSSNSTETQ